MVCRPLRLLRVAMSYMVCRDRDVLPRSDRIFLKVESGTSPAAKDTRIDCNPAWFTAAKPLRTTPPLWPPKPTAQLLYFFHGHNFKPSRSLRRP
jgi:hypothetical protein